MPREERTLLSWPNSCISQLSWGQHKAHATATWEAEPDPALVTATAPAPGEGGTHKR